MMEATGKGSASIPEEQRPNLCTLINLPKCKQKKEEKIHG